MTDSSPNAWKAQDLSRSERWGLVGLFWINAIGAYLPDLPGLELVADLGLAM